MSELTGQPEAAPQVNLALSQSPRPLPLSSRAGTAAIVALALVVAADLLFYRQVPGLSLFVFAAATAAGILIVWRDRLHTGVAKLGMLVALVGAVPLVEHATLLSIGMAMLGLGLLALAASGKLPTNWTTLPAAGISYAVMAPAIAVIDFFRFLRVAGERRLGGVFFRGVVVWLVPLGFALVFLFLFASANPIVETVLSRLNIDALLDLLDPERIILWGFVAALVWPVLLPRLLHKQRRGAAQVMPLAVPGVSESLLFGRAAILRSLIVFNALFAFQTGLDIYYLWTGHALPDGMSYADYAHRGAYPLIVTALLAGAFVLAAMRRDGPGERSPVIRRLVYLWIAQNVMLVISSLLRLDLYVESYSLTELRLAAALWMGLVAIGLVLICARIVLRQSNAWLVSLNLLSLALVLYASSLIDYPWLISSYNVEHSAEMTGKGPPLDLGYLRNLGPGTIPALDTYLVAQSPADPVRHPEVMSLRSELLWLHENGNARDWRAWSYREERLDGYLAQSPVPNTPIAPYSLSAD